MKKIKITKEMNLQLTLKVAAEQYEQLPLTAAIHL